MNQKVLAIESSGKTFSVAVVESFLGSTHLRGEKEEEMILRGEIFFDIGNRHSEILKDTILFLMEGCHWKKEDLSLLAVSTGPGSFTGLRVGISFARTLAQFLSVPLIGIPTFEVLAMGAKKNFSLPKADSLLSVLIDSVGDKILAGFFKPGDILPSEPYQILTVSELYKKVGKKSKIIFVGEGYIRYKKEIKKALGKKVVECCQDQNYPQAKVLAELAIVKAKKLKPSKNSWKKVLPFYLRSPIAVERLNSS